MITFFGHELSIINLVLLMIAAASIGANKGGVYGIALAAIPLFASVLGVKAASGYVLLMYIASDTMAALRYRPKSPKLILQLLPVALVGLVLAAFVGRYLNEEGFKIMMGIMLIGLIILLLLPDRYKKVLQQHKFLGNIFGFVGGFTSMAGNIGGPVMSTYLLSQKIDKDLYLSTYSWFFFTINSIKVLVMVFYWHTITWRVVEFSIGLLPALILGFIIGAIIVKVMDQKKFYNLVTALTILSCLYLFCKMLFS